MKEISLYVDSLKDVLKRQGVTYAELADELGISEASIKRNFSMANFTFERLLQICKITGVHLGELVQMAEQGERSSVHEYSVEQEKYFASFPRALALFDLILRFSSMKKIFANYKITKKEAYTYLAKLDELGLVEWRSGDKIKILVSKNVKWRRGGILQKNLKKQALEEFLVFDSSDQEEISFVTLPLTERSRVEFENKLSELKKEMTRVALIEDKLGLEAENIGFISYLKPWRFSKLTLEKN